MNRIHNIFASDTVGSVNIEYLNSIMDKIISNLSPDLLSHDYIKTQDTAIAGHCAVSGHCAVASEALYFILGGPNFGLKSWCARDIDNTTHWWLELNNTVILDVTVAQYGERLPPYGRGIRGQPCGFMGQRVEIGNRYGFNRRPSKRAQILLDRL